jgi:hypothetical protein
VRTKRRNARKEKNRPKRGGKNLTEKEKQGVAGYYEFFLVGDRAGNRSWSDVKRSLIFAWVPWQQCNNRE